MTEFAQTGAINYSGSVLEITQSNILNNFDYSGDLISDSPTKSVPGSMILKVNGSDYDMTMEVIDYTPKINQLNQSLFEIKIILLIIMFLMILWLTYSLIISFIGKRL